MHFTSSSFCHVSAVLLSYGTFRARLENNNYNINLSSFHFQGVIGEPFLGTGQGYPTAGRPGD
jgi:hypothetical protein